MVRHVSRMLIVTSVLASARIHDSVFDNAAEAFVMLDINAGGGISLLELERGLQRMDIQGVDIQALSKELRLHSGMSVESVYDLAISPACASPVTGGMPCVRCEEIRRFALVAQV